MVKETPSRARCNSRGNIIGTSSVFDPATPETYAFVLKLYDPEILLIRELARVQMKRRIGGPVDPMRPTVYMTVDDQDRIIFAYPDKYEIQVFAPDGTLTRKILKAYDPVTVTAEEKAASVEGASPQVKFDFPSTIRRSCGSSMTRPGACTCRLTKRPAGPIRTSMTSSTRRAGSSPGPR